MREHKEIITMYREAPLTYVTDSIYMQGGPAKK